MNSKTLLLLIALLFVPSLALAQSPGGNAYGNEAPLADGTPTDEEDAADASPTEATPERAAAAPGPKRAGDYRIRVTVRGPDGKPLAEKPVFLRAARPRGPFEPTAPEPVQEWTEFSNANGVVFFDIAPQGLDGLRVHAVVTHDGQPFESAAVTPGDGVKITIRAHERTLDPSVVKIKSLRTVVQMWEEYLVFTQFYQIQNSSDLALDIGAIPDPDYERGIPFSLPLKAQGIQAMGPGENAVVDSTVYWKGFMKPGEVINLQVRFSMSANEPSFVYEQTVDYETETLEVVVPLQTDFEKLPRLDSITLKAPGFDELGRTQNGKSPLDLRPDMEFLAAWGNSAKAGESFTFKLDGLPFEKPKLPWFFFIGGILMAIGVVLYARKELARMESEQGVEDLRVAFEVERTELLNQLEELERQQRAGARTKPEYEAMKLSLREQLALILKKLHDLEEDA